MSEKIIIFGGGPCGMRLAENFIDKGNDVHLYEKEDSLGGCWKVKWENGYFKEHSPRIMTTGYEKVVELVESLDLKDPYNEIYGSSFQSTYKFIKYFLNNLSFLDNLKFMYSLLFLSQSDERNMKEWIDDNNLTTLGRKALRNLSIALANIPEGVSAFCFFDFIYSGLGDGGQFMQFRQGDEWLKKWEKRLLKKGVKIHLNTKINSLYGEGDVIEYALTNKGRVYGNKFLLSLPLWSLKEILKNSKNKNIQDNWMKSEDFTKVCEKLSYSGLGVQLHFKKRTGIDLDENWCGTCMGDWSIIVQNTSHYLEKFTKRKDIKEVWSCVIVDFTRKSKRLDKTPGKLTKEQIGEEVIYQLEKTLNKKIKPEKITYNLIEKKNKKWDFFESAYSANTDGPIKPKGEKIKNLFTVGCQNLNEIAILDGALKSADEFTNKN